MDIKKITRKPSFPIVITTRISKEDSVFLREKNLSPQAIIREAIADLRKVLKDK